MTTVALLLREGRAALAAAAIEQPRREARILLEAATGLDRSALLTSDGWKVGADTEAHYRAWIARRAHREPMAYILGSVEFWSLGFAAAPGVLVPRADSETLIEAAIARFQDQSRPLRLLDIGVGTGCLLLTLLHHYREASGVGTDLSTAALTCAVGNAQRLGVADRLELV
ncbi:MAG: class I SAM-dependent methyltransferase, partial [Geminicoccaceae bacterium]